MAATVLTGGSSASGAATASTPWVWVKTQNLTGFGGGNNTFNGLNSISCPSVSFCLAVGYAQTDQKIAAQKPLAEIWRGKTTWSISYPRNPYTNGGTQLTGVSCGTPTYCMAVGVYPQNLQPPSGDFAELWNGFSWSAPMALPVSVQTVTCVAKACVAAGNIAEGNTVNTSYQEDVVEVWNGKTWTQSQLGSDGPVGGLNGVWCGSTVQCLAVGAKAYAAFEPDAWYYANGTWSEEVPPYPGSNSSLNGVACAGSAPVTCMAVGQADVPLADLFDTSTQTWTVTQPVSLNGPQTFLGVSCPSAALCIAVGSAPVGPMAQAWNGSGWTLMDTSALFGETDQPGHELTSVACPSTAFCFAVGSRQTLVGDQPEVASWGTMP